MNILFIKHFFVGFMVSEIPRVSVFGHFPDSVTLPYRVYYYIILVHNTPLYRHMCMYARYECLHIYYSCRHV